MLPVDGLNHLREHLFTIVGKYEYHLLSGGKKYTTNIQKTKNKARNGIKKHIMVVRIMIQSNAL